MSEDKNQQKTGKQLLNDTQEAAERAHLLPGNEPHIRTIGNGTEA